MQNNKNQSFWAERPLGECPTLKTLFHHFIKWEIHKVQQEKLSLNTNY